MTPLKKRVILFSCLLMFLALDRLAGRQLFGEAQTYVEIVFIFIAAVLVFYIALSQRRVPRNYASEVDRSKLTSLVLERVQNHKRKLRDFIRRIFPS